MTKKLLNIVGFISVVTALLLFSNIKSTLASEAHNIRGWAYNSTYGYISFNCLDDGYAGRFPFAFPFAFNIPPCYSNSHGVNLDASNNFSGEAWNSVLGFIDFSSASSTPSNVFRAQCPSCISGVCSACYKESTREVFGYMKIRTTGEWIKLDGLPNPTQITRYEDPQPGIFSGYASSTFGAISFNCTDTGTCATNNYRVEIGPLEIRQMIAPNWSSNEACSLGAKTAVLKWNRRSGTQSAYQVIVSTANSTTTGKIFDSNQVNNSATQVSLNLPNYDTPYYWFLRLWDDEGTPTAWRQFNTVNGDWISDNFVRNSQKNTIDPNKTFTSYKHEFPKPLFTWSPEQIIIATTSNSFVSNASYYNDSNTLQPCTGSICSFLWTVTEPSINDILTPTLASTSIEFSRATSTVVTLSVTDDAVYTCSTSTILNVNYALPLWKEIKP